jgi:V/A-type H+-transporting ATPase subunit E
MDGEKVTEKIMADAKAEADKIKGEAQEKQNAEQAKLDEQLAEYQKQTETLAHKAAEDEKSHRLSAARMDIAKQLLAEKRSILDHVFAEAHERLRKLSDEDYRRLMTKLMLQAVESGEEEVLVGKDENRIDQGLVNGVNQQLASNNRGNLRLSSEREDISGGFVLRRGKIRNNASFAVLLDQARKELEIELAKELFS